MARTPRLPLREELFTTQGRLSNVWVKFFQEVAGLSAEEAEETYEGLMSDGLGSVKSELFGKIAGLEMQLALLSGQDPSHEGRIKALEDELGDMMEQLDDVIDKLGDVYRLLELFYVELLKSNKIALALADYQAESMEKPLDSQLMDDIARLS